MKKLIFISLVAGLAALGATSASAHIPHHCQHVNGPIKKQVCINKWHRNHDVVVVRDHGYYHHNPRHHDKKVNAKVVVRVPIRF